MKINMIVPFVNNTGGIQVVFKYADALLSMGHDVVIYEPAIPYAFEWSGIKYPKRLMKVLIKGAFFKGYKPQWYDLKTPLKLVRKINDKTIREADVTIATAWPTAYDVAKLPDKCGKKYYFIQHYEAWSGEKSKVDGSFKLGLKPVVIAGWLKDLLKKEFGISDTIVVNNGIELNDFYPSLGKRYDNKKLKVLLLMHEAEFKGMKYGLDAFKKFIDAGYDAELHLFGVSLTHDLPDYAKVHVACSREELRKLYSEADIYLFPSLSEGWGLTVVEAMACKCAVCGTNVGCLLDFGKHKETAMISGPKDVDAMVENMKALADDRKLLETVSLGGYEEAKKCSMEKANAAFENAIKA